jgi:chromobox protein 1
LHRSHTAKRSATKGKKPLAADEDEEPDFEQTHVDAMDKYKDVGDWEDLVENVDTIERGSEGDLKVYMTMWVPISPLPAVDDQAVLTGRTGGEKVAQSTEVAYRRCPQKILKFYEAHLKWVTARQAQYWLGRWKMAD